MTRSTRNNGVQDIATMQNNPEAILRSRIPATRRTRDRSGHANTGSLSLPHNQGSEQGGPAREAAQTGLPVLQLASDNQSQDDANKNRAGHGDESTAISVSASEKGQPGTSSHQIRPEHQAQEDTPATKQSQQESDGEALETASRQVRPRAAGGEQSEGDQQQQASGNENREQDSQGNNAAIALGAMDVLRDGAPDTSGPVDNFERTRPANSPVVEAHQPNDQVGGNANQQTGIFNQATDNANQSNAAIASQDADVEARHQRARALLYPESDHLAPGRPLRGPEASAGSEESTGPAAPQAPSAPPATSAPPSNVQQPPQTAHQPSIPGLQGTIPPTTSTHADTIDNPATVTASATRAASQDSLQSYDEEQYREEEAARQESERAAQQETRRREFELSNAALRERQRIAREEADDFQREQAQQESKQSSGSTVTLSEGGARQSSSSVGVPNMDDGLQAYDPGGDWASNAGDERTRWDEELFGRDADPSAVDEDERKRNQFDF